MALPSGVRGPVHFCALARRAVSWRGESAGSVLSGEPANVGCVIVIHS